jgi:NTP pyrophosphatase (non-canonical NTP hydrolase)
MKLEEEVQEFIDAFRKEYNNEREELADVILVCLNIAHHYGWDIESELFKKVEINEQRANKK